jgi:hypothetical protein
VNISDTVYAFVFRGLLTEESLDKAGRQAVQKSAGLSSDDIIKTLALEYIDDEFLEPAKQMASVYAAIAAFENAVRAFVKKVLLEAMRESWWDKAIPEAIKKKAESRQKEEQKIKWHSKRGEDLLAFTDFGQLHNIITTNTNWPHFENLLQRQQWVQNIFDTMERSRNVIMHSGDLPLEDIERVGICIRDWMKQTGG